VWQIGVDLRKQVEGIGNKLDHDVQTKLGSTNGMLADLRTGIQEAGQGIAEIKKQFSELDQWRSRIEAALTSLTEFRQESTKDRREIRDAVSAQDKRHKRQIEDLIIQLKEQNKRLLAIEQLLEIAGQHEAGS
jgi:chromosome segregation ATPase